MGEKLSPTTILISLLWMAIPGNDPVRADWRQEWEKSLERANEEGQVNVYLTYTQIFGAFQKAYPSIKLVEVVGRSAQIGQRILAERRAGRYVVDVQIGGGTNALTQFISAKMLEPIKPLLILPEVVDESKWWQGRHRYVDPEGKYIFAFVGVPNAGSVSYNTRLVDPQGFRSLWDFIQPAWKGKIVARDPRAPGPGGGAMRFFYYHPELGAKFIKSLFSEMNVTLNRDERQATDWLATGKFALCFFCRDVDKAKQQGLPVNKFGILKEGAGISSQGDTIAFFNKAPHPNAAKVFVNWLLSREGQINYQRMIGEAQGGGGPDSLRVDIPKDQILPEERRSDAVRYLDIDTPERRDMGPIFLVLEAVLAEAKRN